MANVARFAVVWRRAMGQPIGNREDVCTFHVMSSSSRDPYDDVELALLAAQVRDWWNDDGLYGPKMSDAYPESLILDRIEAWRILPTLSDAVVLDDQNLPGTGIGHAMYPPAVCWGVGLRTLVDTRSGRGRLYLPAAEDTDPDVRGAGFVPETLRATLAEQTANLANEIYDSPLGTAEVVLAVYSRVLVDPAPVTHFEIPDRLRTQRRRAGGTTTFTPFGLSGPFD